MPLYHIVLFKLKPGVTNEKLEQWEKIGKAMVGKIPGLLEFHAGRPLVSTAHRAQGYDMGIVVVLETAKDLEVFGPHPAHQEVHELRLQLCDESLAYDMEF